MPTLSSGPARPAARRPSRMPRYRRRTSQCRVPPAKTGTFGNRPASVTCSRPPSSRPTTTRPPDAPRSAAATAMAVIAGTPPPPRRQPGCAGRSWPAGPPRVERAEFLLGHAVDGRPLRAPAAGEDSGAADDTVRIDAVDPDAELAELGGQQPDLVRLICLGRAVGDVGRAGRDGILAADVDDVAAHALRGHNAHGLPGDQE